MERGEMGEVWVGCICSRGRGLFCGHLRLELVMGVITATMHKQASDLEKSQVSITVGVYLITVPPSPSGF
jgi:hypothetical protein